MIRKFDLHQKTLDIRRKTNPKAKLYLVKILHGVLASYSTKDVVVRKEVTSIPESESRTMVSGSNLIIDIERGNLKHSFLGEEVTQITQYKSDLYIWAEGDKSILANIGHDTMKEFYNEPEYLSLIEKYESAGWEIVDVRRTSEEDTNSFYFFDDKSKLTS